MKIFYKNIILMFFHGNDNSNKINEEKLLIVDRTPGSSSKLRKKAANSLVQKKIKNNVNTGSSSNFV